MSSAIKEIERLLGIPDPRLIWNQASSISWHANYEKFTLIVRKGGSYNKSNHGFSWLIGDPNGMKLSWGLVSKGTAHSLKEAKKAARNGLVKLL